MPNDIMMHATPIDLFVAISEIHIEKPMDLKSMHQDAQIRTFHEASSHGL